MMKKRTVTAVAVFVLTFGLLGCSSDDNSSLILTDTTQNASATESTGSYESEKTDEICVYVCGAVMTPGVYYLGEDSRICDAIQCAGGFSEDAAQQYLNQAELLTDSERIYVPTVEEAYALSGSDSSDGSTNSYAGITEDGLVNINYATEDELMTISGIGETRALAIIDYRRENGLFSCIEDITNVSGIGENTFEKIKSYITV